MQFTTVRSKEKDYDIYLKSKNWFTDSRSTKKLFPSFLEVEKTGSQLFESDKHCFVYLERENRGSLLFGYQKMKFTTVRIKEKDYDIHSKSEKQVHSNQEHEKKVSHLFGSGKNRFLAISSLTNTFTAIWREKKVDPCYLEPKQCSSQLLGERKKIMISI